MSRVIYNISRIECTPFHLAKLESPLKSAIFFGNQLDGT